MPARSHHQTPLHAISHKPLGTRTLTTTPRAAQTTLEAMAHQKESQVKVSSFRDAYATPDTTGTWWY